MSPYRVEWDHHDPHSPVDKITVLCFNSISWAKVCAYAISQDNANDVKLLDCNGTQLSFS